jgi:hypothetical protein
MGTSLHDRGGAGRLGPRSLLFIVSIVAHGCHGCATRSKPAASVAHDPSPSRTNMHRSSLQNPGFVSMYDTGVPEQYTLNAAGPRRILTTTRFHQRGAELLELGPEDPASWDVEVPDGAELFGATSGVSPGNAHQLWVGWLVGRRVHMQALMQEHPIEAELGADETPIFPAVMDGAGLASLYAWHPAGAGIALTRRVFSGALKEPPAATGEVLSEIPGRPLVSSAAAVPGERSQHAVIGWIEASDAGAVIGVAVITPDRMRVVRSRPIADTVPFARQRLGIWPAGPLSSQRVRVTALVESTSPGGDYTVATFEVAAPPKEPALTLSESGIPAKQLHAAAFDYVKNYLEPFFVRTYLTTNRALLVGTPPRARRQGIPLDSPLPVLVTDPAYWGTRAADGTFTFEEL